MRINEATSRVGNVLYINSEYREVLDQICTQDRPLVVLGNELYSALCDLGWYEIMSLCIPNWLGIPEHARALLIDAVDCEAIVTFRVHDLRGMESVAQDPVF
jgi:hypothetical protein